jgi:hypothetical protein
MMTEACCKVDRKSNMEEGGPLVNEKKKKGRDPGRTAAARGCLLRSLRNRTVGAVIASLACLRLVQLPSLLYVGL